MFEWLFCYLWKRSYGKFSDELKSGKVMGINIDPEVDYIFINRMNLWLKKIVWCLILTLWP